MSLNLFLFLSSLFAAKAGASRVLAVEASEKMATVATQVVNQLQSFSFFISLMICFTVAHLLGHGYRLLKTMASGRTGNRLEIAACQVGL